MAYPQLLRFDPLAVRISETSLMISNVVFSAECVVGLAFTGFRIYASSVGNPIYEEEVKITNNTARNTARDIIASKAGLWLTDLQDSVTTVNDRTTNNKTAFVRQTSIKDSIDRAGWQQHYDLVGKVGEFPSIDWAHYYVDGAGIIEDAIIAQTQRINSMNSTLNTVNNTLNTVSYQVSNDTDTSTLKFFAKRAYDVAWGYSDWTTSTSIGTIASNVQAIYNAVV